MSQTDFSIIVCIPGEEPASYPLEDDSISFGRSPENNLQILVAEVSVRHGSFDREGDSYRIIDPGSTNGTRLNGQPVGPEGAVLKSMDRLTLGTVVTVYFVPSSILAATALDKLVASLEATAQPPARPKTAPVPVGAGSTPAGVAPIRAALPVTPSPANPVGGATVRLDQVRAPGVGGVRPAAPPTPARQPLPGPPAGVPLKAPAPGPVKPAVGIPPKAPTATPLPATPGVRPPMAPPAAVPVRPNPGASTVPIKRVAPGGPSTIPLPKTPPKPGQ